MKEFWLSFGRLGLEWLLLGLWIVQQSIDVKTEVGKANHGVVRENLWRCCSPVTSMCQFLGVVAVGMRTTERLLDVVVCLWDYSNSSSWIHEILKGRSSWNEKQYITPMTSESCPSWMVSVLPSLNCCLKDTGYWRYSSDIGIVLYWSSSCAALIW